MEKNIEVSLLFDFYGELLSEKKREAASLYFNEDLSLSEIADVAGYHKKYLSSTFKKQFGMGISEFLRVLRIRYAVMLMENGVTSVKNVAALSGFSDPLYFSKVFTEMIGVSPSQYQKQSKPQEDVE